MKERTGLIITDDPLKPDEDYSAAKRKGISIRFKHAMRSRLVGGPVSCVKCKRELSFFDYMYLGHFCQKEKSVEQD